GSAGAMRSHTNATASSPSAVAMLQPSALACFLGRFWTSILFSATANGRDEEAVPAGVSATERSQRRPEPIQDLYVRFCRRQRPSCPPALGSACASSRVGPSSLIEHNKNKRVDRGRKRF